MRRPVGRNYNIAVIAMVCFAVTLVNMTSSQYWIGIDTWGMLFNDRHRKSELVSHEDVLGSRLLRASEVCSRTNQTTGMTRIVTGNSDLNFTFCVVPKAGCTTWLRVLQYLAGQGSRDEGPNALSKYDIHIKAGNYSLMKRRIKSPDMIETSLRYMTVRDPYTRLWSAYIDKLLLPDFWTSKGKMIIRMVRRNRSLKSIQCGHDVTFSEFIEYVLTIGHKQTYANQDQHWLPASDICDPCAFRPEVIGKQETFMADFLYTASRLGLTDIAESVFTKDSDDFEIEDEVDYNFKIYVSFSHCISLKDLCSRLWTAFQYNGYIPPLESFDVHFSSANIGKGSFMSAIRAVRATFNVTRADKTKWREEALKKAFETISESQKRGIEALYESDFELFGYNSRPNYLL